MKDDEKKNAEIDLDICLKFRELERIEEAINEAQDLARELRVELFEALRR